MTGPAMILFLDFDGVLHPAVNYDATQLLSKLPMLETVLRHCPDVEVVISSTWRENRTLAQLQALFSPDIAPRIAGVTPQWRNIQSADTYGTYVRQAEVEAWLRSAGRAWQQWLAVDDQPHLFRPFCKQLLLTNPTTGLTESDCIGLAQLLGRAQ
jgi:hypothetical protein